MEGLATVNTMTTTIPHTQIQVNGNHIHVSRTYPVWNRKTWIKLAVVFGFSLLISILNFIFGFVIPGCVILGVCIVVLVCLIRRYRIVRESGMQTVSCNQVSQGGVIVIQAQSVPAGQPHPPQGYQSQSQPYPSQQYPPQAYPTQIYPPQYPQPSSPSPAHPSNQTPPGDKQPIAEGGVTPASTGDTTHPQPGGASGQAVSGNVPASSGSGPTSLPGSDIPPPPSYNEAMGIGSNNRLQ